MTDEEDGSRKRKKKSPPMTQAKKHLMTIAAAKKAAALSGDSILSVPAQRDDSSDEDADIALTLKMHSKKDSSTGDSASAVDSGVPGVLTGIPVDTWDSPDAGDSVPGPPTRKPVNPPLKGKAENPSPTNAGRRSC